MKLLLPGIKKNCCVVPLNHCRWRTRRHQRHPHPSPVTVVTLWQPYHSPGSTDNLGGARGWVISRDLCAQWKGHGFDQAQTGSVSINRLHPLAALRPVETARGHAELQTALRAWVTAKLSCFFRLRRTGVRGGGGGG